MHSFLSYKLSSYNTNDSSSVTLPNINAFGHNTKFRKEKSTIKQEKLQKLDKSRLGRNYNDK